LCAPRQHGRGRADGSRGGLSRAYRSHGFRSRRRAYAATAAVAVLAIAALTFTLWKVRSVVILLLLALTFAAAIRPGVQWLEHRRFPRLRSCRSSSAWGP